MPLENVTLSPSEYAGAMLFRHADATINYDSGGTSFVPADLNMNRFQNVILQVRDGSPNEVRWDEPNDQILVYDGTGTDTEVSGGTTVDVKITGIGR